MTLQFIDLIEVQDEQELKRILCELQEDVQYHTEATLRLAYAIESQKNNKTKQ